MVEKSEFERRMAQIRARFAHKLGARIDDTAAALPALLDRCERSGDRVAAAYRQFHEISGIGETVGFEETARAARRLEALLIGAFRARRGLRTDEWTEFRSEFEALRAAAQAETRHKV